MEAFHYISSEILTLEVLHKILTENRHSQSKFDYVSGQIVEVTQKLNNFQTFVEKFRVTMSEMNMKIQKLGI